MPKINSAFIKIATFLIILVPSSQAMAASSCLGTTGVEVIYCFSEKALNWMGGISGIITIIMLMVAGFMYMTSGGDSKKIMTAKGALTGAIVGAVIVMLSFFLGTYVRGLLDIDNNGTVTGTGGNVTSGSGASGGNTSGGSASGSNSGSGSNASTTGSGSSVSGQLPDISGTNPEVLGTTTRIVFPPVYTDSTMTTTVKVENPTDFGYWSCGQIREKLKEYYPDASVKGEKNYTYYVKGVELLSNPAKARMYYKKTAGSTSVFYDEWTWESSVSGYTNWYKTGNRNGTATTESAIKNTCPSPTAPAAQMSEPPSTGIIVPDLNANN